ncbi:hypothetical protein [Duganella sp. Root1480D1]|uniref:hypothetical protein n=1 Tax=Duganella sp. Root1480D1 TaxID=1736471 RepID=UPI00070B3DEC|nr:hypothetical protein [Duganella sp. Root1480D1]KQZ44217.1 hypothetical protein ASD58_18585 [Duganella sp. Root1480D1]
MITAFNLAGFFAAHAIWCVSDGEGLVPMFAHSGENDERQMERLLAGDDLGASVELGKNKLESNEADANDGVLVYDGRIPVQGQKYDAIIIEIRSYFSPASKAVMAVPYKPAASGDFRVFKPKLLQWEECDDFDVNMVVQSFFEGVDAHEKGAEVWNRALDQSI